MTRRLVENKVLWGKYKDRVVLHCLIPKGQDTMLTLILRETGKSKGVIVSEAIQLLLSEYKKMGIG